jgi:hypothetical protein
MLAWEIGCPGPDGEPKWRACLHLGEGGSRWHGSQGRSTWNEEQPVEECYTWLVGNMGALKQVSGRNKQELPKGGGGMAFVED